MTITKKAIILSFLSGFLSLGLEVIWIRLFGFYGLSLPQIFSLTLALFLLGIACGSLIGKRLCQSEKGTIQYIGYSFLLSSIFDCLTISLIINFPIEGMLGIFIVCIFFSALLRGIVFPIVHHLGAEQKKTGAAISNVYFANVLGCTISPILIGFYLLDIFTTQQTYFIITFITLVTAAFCIQEKWLKSTTVLMATIIITTTFVLPENMIHSLAKKKDENGKYLKLEKLIENKHGFIQVYLSENNDELVFGGNAYDGMLNTNLNHSHNGIERAYLLPVIAPHAKNILVIGLSTASWTRVLTSMPELESMTVIELNPGYPKLAGMYSEMGKFLQDKRVNLITDDGRRWLNRNPEKKFDFILMNTTFHWRNYASNLLSKEFLELTKSHLNENGFIYFNTTESYDAYYTSKEVFPHVYQYMNMSLASLNPISALTKDQITSGLSRLKWENGSHVFNSQEELEKGVNTIFIKPLIRYEEINFQNLGRPLEIITDGNMIPEYKYGFFN
ncbi:fused MFS/spermidine synthase [Aggregatibacter actinomycetemcomitans]|uniref:fused MFS/spermidine synthase n=1 Tax=Aggregatibacter actinomycetemcomitans TaxID=714 RepID=UPI00197B1FCD|nr:fused MFS/spermidine synthase [Aggregatibacter actinomycetemcomitans]MBN6074768.1 fused MFS/spermidine synthase [Aggregatibacter actinomycetemcomitans]